MFIAVDGPDGAGKSTVSALLAQELSKTVETALTSEPTDSPVGKRIRGILRTGEGAKLLTELFVRDRREHLETFIQPRLDKGVTVVCDRYKYSTVCYQQIQGESAERLIALNSGFLVPDIAFILVADSAKTLAARLRQRSGRDIFESAEMLERALAIYRRMPSYFPGERIVTVNCDAPAKEVVGKMLAEIGSGRTRQTGA